MTEDVARLRLSVASSGVDKAQRKLKDLAKTGGDAAKGFKQSFKRRETAYWIYDSSSGRGRRLNISC